MTTIGYYVHHHGSGHEHRFAAIAERMPADIRLVPISELPLTGGVHLPGDVPVGPFDDPTASGALHWAPIGRPEAGTAAIRLRTIAEWLAGARPAGIVVDVSVEMLVTCRLAGVRTVAVRQHGDRSDAAHRLGYACADRLLAPFPADFEHASDATMIAKTDYAGFVVAETAPSPSSQIGEHDAVVLWGTGGGRVSGATIDAFASVVAGTVFCAGREIWPDDDMPTAPNVVDLGWVPDPGALLVGRPVVLGSAGDNCTALAARHGCAFLAVPQHRPFDEQVRLAATLDRNEVAVVAPTGTDRAVWADAVALARRRRCRWARHLPAGGGAAAAARIIVERLT